MSKKHYRYGVCPECNKVFARIPIDSDHDEYEYAYYVTYHVLVDGPLEEGDQPSASYTPTRESIRENNYILCEYPINCRSCSRKLTYRYGKTPGTLAQYHDPNLSPFYDKHIIYHAPVFPFIVLPIIFLGISVFTFLIVALYYIAQGNSSAFPKELLDQINQWKEVIPMYIVLATVLICAGAILLTLGIILRVKNKIPTIQPGTYIMRSDKKECFIDLDDVEKETKSSFSTKDLLSKLRK